MICKARLLIEQLYSESQAHLVNDSKKQSQNRVAWHESKWNSEQFDLIESHTLHQTQKFDGWTRDGD
ncbi:hypothetical protein BK049_13055 [Bacillus xiamenensis]|uniref:Uncharacterized protein n=1 Tax=Bacillus xiamenensis TaxID=1178537 RepID=A0AAC9NCE7_9BACI|nr:hypothetical protein BK049_13055 [Bacillus xiamenensis]MBG9911771.1 hypothetical protein [Bacillus xiamenensis]